MSREKAKELYDGGMSLTDIAEKLNVSASTVRSWKARYNWDNVQRNATQRATQRNRVETELIRSVEDNKSLTEAQKIFCLHYVRTFNASAAYHKAHPGCKHSTAMVKGCEQLKKKKIVDEIRRLKSIRNTDIQAKSEDVVEKMIQIAFSDLSDFVEWGQEERTVCGPFGPILVRDPLTDEERELKERVNTIRFRDSTEVDSALVSEVKLGKNGASIKLLDRMKALDWLTKYFELNPLDSHKVQYDTKRLALDEDKQTAEIERIKADTARINAVNADPDDGMGDDEFLEALKGGIDPNWTGDEDDED